VKPGKAAAVSARHASRGRRAVETFGSAAAAIGPIVPGLSLFLVTRGQFSLIDMVHHVIREIGPCGVSVWCWAIADYEVEAMGGLMISTAITGARLIVDRSAEQRSAPTIARWRDRFGVEAVRVCKNHAKMARVWSDDRRVLIRGSMNLNFNPRFEQVDLTEGGEEFSLVERLEEELPVLRARCANVDADAASKLGKSWEQSSLSVFHGLKPWEK
jgi:hypothetical protein